jgi:hypothetical protein
MDELGVALRIGSDETGMALGWDGSTLQLTAAKAHPPGQPLELVLWPERANPLKLGARSLGSRRRSDDAFDVRVRLVNLSRESREQLAQALGPR